jgi:hypothetical protein
MADITVKILTPASSYALLTLAEVKGYFGITDTSQDVQLQALIDQYSDTIATMCNRVFGKEKVREIWRGNTPVLDCNRIYLTRYPVAKDEDIETILAPGLAETGSWELDNAEGKLLLFGSYAEPVQVIYTGGYNLPAEAPPALKQAALLMIQSARVQGAREAVSGIKSIAHRETRVQFFDAPSGSSDSGGSPIKAMGETVNALLYKYTRLYV